MKTKASDPEDLPISWEWTWSGPAVNKSGKAEGRNFDLSELPTGRSTTKKHSIFQATDALGAFTTKKQDLNSLRPSIPPKITRTDATSTVWEE